MSENNQATHGPSGKPHPQFILDYLAAYANLYPDNTPPAIWDRGNGWCQIARRSARRGEIERMTENLISTAARSAK